MSWLRRCPGGGASFLRRRSVTQGGETCRQHPCLARADPGNGGKIFRGGGDHGFKAWKMRPQQPLGGWSHAGNPAQFPGQGRLGTGAAVPANSVTVGCIPHMLEKQQLGRTFPQGERVAPGRKIRSRVLPARRSARPASSLALAMPARRKGSGRADWPSASSHSRRARCAAATCPLPPSMSTRSAQGGPASSRRRIHAARAA